ncbi:MAG: T9SS type A sorting domain-containing protein [Saprospiraceae bacterium]|nr:T9SS type A sorting domain-containing protein [Saprospiraceae bacterium]
MSDNNASVSNLNGQLLFYTNGCKVVQANHQLMENGDSINFGKFIIDFWANCEYGYIGWQDIIILNDPLNVNGYYILHKTRDYIPNPYKSYTDALKYTYVDMSFNNGNGSVLKKNIVIYEENDLCSSYLTAINHANIKDWWLIQMRENSNAYLKFLIDENGPMLVDSQNIGNKTTRNTSAGGFAKFSPDGKKWAWYTYENGLHLFDFDRSSGELSKHRIKPIEFGKRKVFTGLEFSPNSRFIYISAYDTLLQVDTWAENLDYEVIDTYDNGEQGFANFHGMNLAPDCKIYMTSSNSTATLSRINFPNKKGKACDFRQHEVPLFATNGIGIPNFPRLRVDEVDICDSTELYTAAFDIQSSSLFFKIYPNPVYDIASLEIARPGSLYLYDLKGTQVLIQAVKQGDNYLDMQGLKAGVYLIKFVDMDGRWLTQKIIKTAYND